MRTQMNHHSFLSRVRKFLPCRKERRKKPHISTEKQIAFLDSEKRKIDKLLDNAKYFQGESLKMERAISLRIKKLKRAPIYGIPGLKEMKICQEKCSLRKVRKTFNYFGTTIQRLELCKKKMENNPHEFLKKNNKLNECQK